MIADLCVNCRARQGTFRGMCDTCRDLYIALHERDQARRLLCRWRRSLDRSLTANGKLLEEINDALGIGWNEETPTKYDALDGL